MLKSHFLIFCVMLVFSPGAFAQEPKLKLASDSLRKSKFACEDCGNENRFFSMAIRFKMDDPPKTAPWPAANGAPSIARAESRARKSRSARCLYLWRCTVR